jgi:hypothetical protein
MNEITLFELQILKYVRGSIVKDISEIPREKLWTIPSGFKTNLLWQIGHLMVTQQVLCYLFTDTPLKIQEDYFLFFRKGTDPANWNTITGFKPDIDIILNSLIDLPGQMEVDYKAGLLKNYKPTITSSGLEIKSIEQAIAYNNHHEGLHYGQIGAMKKLVS